MIQILQNVPHEPIIAMRNPMRICDLGSDLLGHILSCGLSHRTLGHCAQACKTLFLDATRRIKHAYADENPTWERITDKLHLNRHARCTCLGRYDGTHPPRVKSVELLKHALGWDEHEPYHARFCYSPNDMIRMAFFCDCRGCTHENLMPCGRGESSLLTEQEQTHIVKAFQVTWWDDLDNAYVFGTGRLVVA